MSALHREQFQFDACVHIVRAPPPPGDGEKRCTDGRGKCRRSPAESASEMGGKDRDKRSKHAGLLVSCTVTRVHEKKMGRSRYCTQHQRHDKRAGTHAGGCECVCIVK